MTDFYGEKIEEFLSEGYSNLTEVESRAVLGYLKYSDHKQLVSTSTWTLEYISSAYRRGKRKLQGEVCKCRFQKWQVLNSIDFRFLKNASRVDIDAALKSNESILGAVVKVDFFNQLLSGDTELDLESIKFCSEEEVHKLLKYPTKFVKFTVIVGL